MTEAQQDVSCAPAEMNPAMVCCILDTPVAASQAVSTFSTAALALQSVSQALGKQRGMKPQLREKVHLVQPNHHPNERHSTAREGRRGQRYNVGRKNLAHAASCRRQELNQLQPRAHQLTWQDSCKQLPLNLPCQQPV